MAMKKFPDGVMDDDFLKGPRDVEVEVGRGDNLSPTAFIICIGGKLPKVGMAGMAGTTLSAFCY